MRSQSYLKGFCSITLALLAAFSGMPALGAAKARNLDARLLCLRVGLCASLPLCSSFGMISILLIWLCFVRWVSLQQPTLSSQHLLIAPAHRYGTSTSLAPANHQEQLIFWISMQMRLETVYNPLGRATDFDEQRTSLNPTIVMRENPLHLSL